MDQARNNEWVTSSLFDLFISSKTIGGGCQKQSEGSFILFKLDIDYSVHHKEAAMLTMKFVFFPKLLIFFPVIIVSDVIFLKGILILDDSINTFFV